MTVSKAALCIFYGHQLQRLRFRPTPSHILVSKRMDRAAFVERRNGTLVVFGYPWAESLPDHVQRLGLERVAIITSSRRLAQGRALAEAIGPILICVLTVVVGYFAMAIFMPMWDLTKMAK